MPRSPLFQSLFGAPELQNVALRGALANGLGHTIVTFMEINFDDNSHAEQQSGLDDTQVSWWLAGDDRLADANRVAKEDPSWTCPICSEGLEAEGAHGWLVRICNPSESKPPSAVSSPTSKSASPEVVKQAPSSEGHLYHEGCLRRWLLKKNACPVCRRTPVIPLA